MLPHGVVEQRIPVRPVRSERDDGQMRDERDCRDREWCERGIACRRYVYADVRSRGGVNHHDWQLQGCMVERLDCGAPDTEGPPSSGRWSWPFDAART